MKLINLILLIALSSFFSACENSTDVNVDLPYVEYTVIFARLPAGQVFDGVRITHTLPLSVQYDIKKAEIKDAVIYLMVDGLRIIPLHYVSDGLYKSVTPFNIEAGRKYELFAEIGKKSVYSKTIVPQVPQVVQTTNAGNQYLSADVRANPGEAYGAVWIISGGGQTALEAEDFHSVETSDHFPSNVTVRTTNIPSPYNTPAYSSTFFIQVYAFDEAYKDYFLTKTGSNPIDNTFTSGGGQVKGNVYGDHVIGLFIGSAEGSVIHP